MTASDDQLSAVFNRQKGELENRLNFEAKIISSQVEVHDLSELLKRVLQELPEVQKEVIHLAFKGISGREIAAKSEISLRTDKTLHSLA